MKKEEREEFMKFLAEQSGVNAENITKTLEKTLYTRMDAIETKLNLI